MVKNSRGKKFIHIVDDNNKDDIALVIECITKFFKSHSNIFKIKEQCPLYL